MRAIRVNRFFLALTLVSVLLSANCATLIMSKTEYIPVTSSPRRATVSVNGKQMGETPLTLKLVRGSKKQVLRFESPGYHPFEIRVQRKPDTYLVLGDVLLGAVFGWVLASGKALADDEVNFWTQFVLYGAICAGVPLLVDLGSGTGLTLPQEITITLKKADGPPRVDIMLVDLDDFRKIKWIRVRGD
jgi:hypothetical protein